MVGKYYEHFYPQDPDADARTNISYLLAQQTSDTSFTTQWFDAGFKQTDFSSFSVRNGKVFLDSSAIFYGWTRDDTAKVEIRNPIFEIWDAELGEGLIEFFDYGGDQYEVEKTQNRSIDSTILDRSAKTLLGDRRVKSIERDTVFNFQYATTYVKGLGLYCALSNRAVGRFVTELIEEMPLAEFRELQRNRKHRVAYIDPERTMDDALYFSLCGSELEIADYYNSNDDVRYAGDKGAMMEIIRSKVDYKKIKPESGYLTFHFVVNCHGEAGRFVVDQASLDYQDMQFSRQTIEHLYEISYGLKKWRPSAIQEEPRDSYVYLSYKLQNGVITDVLP